MALLIRRRSKTIYQIIYDASLVKVVVEANVEVTYALCTRMQQTSLQMREMRHSTAGLRMTILMKTAMCHQVPCRLHSMLSYRRKRLDTACKGLVVAAMVETRRWPRCLLVAPLVVHLV